MLDYMQERERQAKSLCSNGTIYAKGFKERENENAFKSYRYLAFKAISFACYVHGKFFLTHPAI